MTTDELTPEAVAILKSLIYNPHPIPNGLLLQLLMATRLVMGSPNKVHATPQGLRLLAQYGAECMHWRVAQLQSAAPLAVLS